jgi:hypothetical protein
MHRARFELAQLLNLLAPGVGQALIGRPVTACVLALSFALSANGAVAATLLVPDDVPAWLQNLCIGAAAIVYVVAQGLLAHSLRIERRRTNDDRRRTALRRVRELLTEGRTTEALSAVQRLSAGSSDDLLAALWTARVCTAAADRDAARRAWARVRELDRRHIYSRELALAEAALRDQSPGRAEPAARTSVTA